MSNEPHLYPMEGRVAAILNPREIVINIGAALGVKKGQKFAVLASHALEIRDPITQVVLDTVDREKVRVEANEVRKNVTICRTYRMRGGILNFGMTSDVMRMLSKEVPETLQIHHSSTLPPLPEEHSYVKVNDRVILVDED